MQYQYLLYSYCYKHNSIPRHSRRPLAVVAQCITWDTYLNDIGPGGAERDREEGLPRGPEAAKQSSKQAMTCRPNPAIRLGPAQEDGILDGAQHEPRRNGNR
ncbi:uncharacterized protein TrAFT101_009141 [Trichoderma asperellum]|uniref:uncharacterized protein n=1 Tax=Trichoderma asperellum TaxID=101201 RepID=UPI00332DC7BD|nr:hypothetical protein TrAFT101_009141 [Trichoderma asperellum]